MNSVGYIRNAKITGEKGHKIVEAELRCFGNMNQDIFTGNVMDYIEEKIPKNEFKIFLQEVIRIAYKRKIFKTRYSCSSFVLMCEHKMFGGKGK